MAANHENPAVTALRRQSSRYAARVADARRNVAAAYRDRVERIAALEEALDEIRPSYQRYWISRRLEVASLVILGGAEVVVAGTVVQALGAHCHCHRPSRPGRGRGGYRAGLGRRP